MSKKFLVRIQRTEWYSHDVEVEADSMADAIREVERLEEEGEYDHHFDAFDDVETHVYCPAESEV